MLNELLSRRRLEPITADGDVNVTTAMTIDIGSQNNGTIDQNDTRNGAAADIVLRNMLQNVRGRGHVEKDAYESKTDDDDDDVEPVDEFNELNNNERALNLKTCVDEKKIERMDIDEENRRFVDSLKDDDEKGICRDLYVDKSTAAVVEKYVSSPESDIFDDDLDGDVSAVNKTSPQSVNVEQTEQKRTRVENIVTSMRSSPLPSVNGCKKRKLYQPQHQHYLADVRNTKCDDIYNDNDDDDDVGKNVEEDVVADYRKIDEKDALENQMRAMQEQLDEMERKYTRLRDLRVKVDQFDDYEESFSPKKKTRLQSPSTTPLSRTPASSPFKEAANGGCGGTTPPRTVHNDKHLSRRDRNSHGKDYIGAALPFMQHQKHHHYYNNAHLDLSNIGAVFHTESSQTVQKNKSTHAKRGTGYDNQSSYRRAVKVSDLARPSTTKPPTPAPGTVSNNNCFDLEGLADALKSEITLTLTNLIDIIVTRFVQQRHVTGRDGDEAARAAEQLNKDLMLASQLLDRKSPRSKHNGRENSSTDKKSAASNKSATENLVKLQSSFAKPSMAAQINAADAAAAMKNPAAAAALYSSMNCFANTPAAGNVFDYPESAGGVPPEQNEALSLVVPQKKKRHKVTDSRVTPRTVNRILSQDENAAPSAPKSPTSSSLHSPTKFGSPAGSPPPPSLSRSYSLAHNVPMLPVSLPTSVAIPNPILHESQVYSPYSIFYEQRRPQSSSPPTFADQSRDGSPPSSLGHHTIFHSALMGSGATQQSQQRSQSQRRKGSSSPDYTGTSIDCNSIEYDGMTATLSTLSPLHLRKAKLMFFWVRYPNPTVLKMYFPDVKFNKQNSAQLVKWFSNFREFYYSQIEKYARTELANGRKDVNDLHVSTESEIYKILNMHYNRNDHIQVPTNFRYVVEQTLKEIFQVIQLGKDKETSWKKPIYKVIGALDDHVPEYFKLQSFLDQLA